MEQEHLLLLLLRLIPANDFKFTLPIPTAERQANPSFAQSPNY
jgi:hypothetical protein